MPGIFLQPPKILAGAGLKYVVERTYECTGCHQMRTFAAPTERLVGQQIASAGWKAEPMHGRFECPACWTEYERSVMRASKGNS